MRDKTICILPEIKKVGGPASFQRRFIREAANQQVTVHSDPTRQDIGAYLVIGAPRKFIPQLIRARLKNIPVVQRLNGMNWIHQVVPSDWLYDRKADFANFRLSQFRRHLASGIVYQSLFCRDHWNDVYGVLERKPECIIYNAVDLSRFKPRQDSPSSDLVKLLIVEGNLQYGSEFNLEQAVRLAQAVSARLRKDVRLQIAGNVSPEAQQKTLELVRGQSDRAEVEFLGVISQESLIQAENDAHLLFSAELHPACPNAVIEALANGLPVIGFDTGSLKDVVGDGGIVVPYGADAWKLERPVLEPLIDAAVAVIQNNLQYRQNARRKAETAFDLRDMTRAYLDFLLG